MLVARKFFFLSTFVALGLEAAIQGHSKAKTASTSAKNPKEKEAYPDIQVDVVILVAVRGEREFAHVLIRHSAFSLQPSSVTEPSKTLTNDQGEIWAKSNLCHPRASQVPLIAQKGDFKASLDIGPSLAHSALLRAIPNPLWQLWLSERSTHWNQWSIIFPIQTALQPPLSLCNVSQLLADASTLLAHKDHIPNMKVSMVGFWSRSPNEGGSWFKIENETPAERKVSTRDMSEGGNSVLVDGSVKMVTVNNSDGQSRTWDTPLWAGPAKSSQTRSPFGPRPADLAGAVTDRSHMSRFFKKDRFCAVEALKT
ncbi:hypothetical protein C8J56DRAFT_881130 [Mycena floridula]|nr:hypothetical protein C8J56DRAFT_881130 [Mycena floridula]